MAFSWASRPTAEVTGRPFSDLVDEFVFRPAAMRGAARKHRDLPLPPAVSAALAVPYSIGSDGRVLRADPPPPQGDGAAGGVVATAMDLARFDNALVRDTLLAPAQRTLLWTPARTPAGAPLPYGLGWFVRVVAGRQLAWHTGLWEGRYSALYLKVLDDEPAERLTLILLAKSDGLAWLNGLGEAAIERSVFATGFCPHSRRDAPRVSCGCQSSADAKGATHGSGDSRTLSFDSRDPARQCAANRVRGSLLHEVRTVHGGLRLILESADKRQRFRTTE